MSPDDIRALGALSLSPDEQKDDEWAAGHYSVFMHEAMPVASLFLSADGMLGGSVSESAYAAVSSKALDMATLASVPADHAGVLLYEAARVLESEGQPAAYRFVVHWLAPWLPLCTQAIQRLTAHQDFLDWARRVEELLATACESEGSEGPGVLPEGEPEDILSNERTDLARIGLYLATPARSALFLTHSDIRVLSRALSLPIGFGSRARGLEGLLRSAVSYERVDDVCLALESHIDETEAMWYGLERRAPGHWMDCWSSRLVQTRRTLRRLATEADG